MVERERKDRDTGAAEERRLEMTNLKPTANYVRYLLTGLATVAFGFDSNCLPSG
jgi:hypothetical protein